MAEAATKLPIKTEMEQTERRPVEWRPFDSLRREIDRLFEDFSWRQPFSRRPFDIEPFWQGELSWGKVPAVDLVEKDKAYEITAELPGMNESNVTVSFSDGNLTIKGEKKEEKEEQKKDLHLSERRYGSFQRTFYVPPGVDADKIEANFKNGVLTVTLPKTAQAQQKQRQITINKG
jgi:HSP20 family protein